MKLEIKHLASYLPYELKGFCTDDLQGVEIMNGLQKISDSCIEVISDKEPMDLIYFKPILFPLSSLTKEITINGETFVPIYKIYEFEQWDTDELEEIINDGTIEGIYSDLDLITYSQTERLFEWKIDVFGLIEAGFAEPVTGNFNPYK